MPTDSKNPGDLRAAGIYYRSRQDSTWRGPYRTRADCYTVAGADIDLLLELMSCPTCQGKGECSYGGGPRRCRTCNGRGVL